MSDGAESTDLGDATSVLLYAPGVRDAPVEACAALLSNGEVGVDRVVGVTVGSTPDDWLRAWQDRAGPATSLTCVDVQAKARSASAAEGSAGLPAATLRTVDDPTDLQALGETLGEVLADAEAADERVAVCLHSLSDLLGHVDDERAFGFLVTLDDRAERRGAMVVAHLDSTVHDDGTAELFSAVCDAVVEFDDASMRIR